MHDLRDAEPAVDEDGVLSYRMKVVSMLLAPGSSRPSPPRSWGHRCNPKMRWRSPFATRQRGASTVSRVTFSTQTKRDGLLTTQSSQAEEAPRSVPGPRRHLAAADSGRVEHGEVYWQLPDTMMQGSIK
jgi:hypothetical protein